MIRLVLVVALTACTPAAWRPPALAETVRVEGDIVVRGEADGTISLTTLVTLGDVSATGFVRLRTAEISTASRSEHIALARARAWYALAGRLPDPALSLQAATRGADSIQRMVRVDSRASMLANLSVMNGDIPDAARTMREFLHFSLRAYVRRFHDEVW